MVESERSTGSDGPSAGSPAWFERAFAREYLDVYPHRNVDTARSEVEGLVRRGLSGRVLDLGCGYGRHSLVMAELGLDVVGLDLSFDLLRHARTLPGGTQLTRRLVRGDFRRLPFRRASFDALAMLFSSFGYFDGKENEEVLEEIARVLRPGGTAVFDLMNPERIRATLVPESRRESGGRVLVERRRIEGSRVKKAVTLVEPDGSEESWEEDVRLYEPGELDELLARHALSFQRAEGDFDGSPLTSDAPRQIVWARRS